MKLSTTIWNTLSYFIKSSILMKYDPTILVSVLGDLEQQLNLPHKGFYIGINNAADKKLCRSGFLEDKQTNILKSVYKVIEATFIEIEAKNVAIKSLPSASFSFTIVWDVIFSNNGLAWDENQDGVYFTWGDQYKGMYLPYEIQKMNISKVEIMNRLCSFEAGLPSNLWRLPEGLVHRIIADSYTLQ